jgi:hypothetical protein
MTEQIQANQQIYDIRHIKAHDEVLRKISILNVLDMNNYSMKWIDGEYYIHIPRRNEENTISASLCTLISYDYRKVRRGRTVKGVYYNRASEYVQFLLRFSREGRERIWGELVEELKK